MSKEIILTQGQKAIVDDDDFERINQYKWFAQYMPKANSFYASRHSSKKDGRRSIIYMSRFIINAPQDLFVDHINHDTLDNRKENLRLATCQQNLWNRSPMKGKSIPYKGVSRNGNRYKAGITINGKEQYLGSFKTPEAAAEAYKSAAGTIQGKFKYGED